MSYKTILLHLHDNTRRDMLIAAAERVATDAGSHVIGLAVVPPIVVVPGMDSGPAVIVEDHRIAYRADMDRLKAAFQSSMQGQSFASEWAEADAAYDDVVARVLDYGRSVDLIICSQKDPKWHFSDYLEMPDRVIVESGRPVLLLPRSGEARAFGERVVVAWNGKREAARAVFDALPLLQRAAAVTVVWIDPQNDGEAAGDLPGAEICAALARHGVKCEATQNVRPAQDVGTTLLSSVKSFGGDMLVMGCYGHSRMREFVFGGATRHVLENMTVPVLMSH